MVFCRGCKNKRKCEEAYIKESCKDFKSYKDIVVQKVDGSFTIYSTVISLSWDMSSYMMEFIEEGVKKKMEIKQSDIISLRIR